MGETSESVDLFEALDRSDVGRRIMERLAVDARARDGAATQRTWACEDGWLVIYTTSRVVGGPHDGRFVVQAAKPVGRGARTGDASEWHEAYRREFATRKAAKQRALELFYRHSPSAAERHGWNGKGYDHD